MSETKWTPGPWQQNGSHICGPGPQHIAVCQVLNLGSVEQVERFDADARLIAAAPQEDAALVNCVKTLEYLFSLPAVPYKSEILAAIRAGRAALAKARGEA